MVRRTRGRALPSTLRGVVRDLAHTGEAVVVTEQGIVLAVGGAPGEEVVVGELAREGATWIGRVVDVVRASEARVEPACRHAARCGGCPWMHLRLSAQEAHKARFAAEAVGRPVPLEASPLSLGYRHRARLHYDARRGSRALGYHAWRSRRVVDIDVCPALAEPLAGALALVRGEVLPWLHGVGELRLARGRGGAPTVFVHADSPQPVEAYRAVEALVRSGAAAGAALRVGEAGAPAEWGDPREELVAADGTPRLGSRGGFSQAHDVLNRALVDEVLEAAACEGRSVLELYAGSGNLTLPLAARAASLTAIESDVDAAHAARANLAARGLSQARVLAADVAACLGGDPVDVVVLDPPRTGARGLMEAIARKAGERVVYVSCNPATLGRDLRALEAQGLRVDRSRAFDMFPHTPHVELVVRLVR